MNNPEKTSPPLAQEASEQQSSNEQTFAASGIKSLETEELANVTGGGGITQVLNHVGYITAHTLGVEAPQGLLKPIAVKPQKALEGDSRLLPGHTIFYKGEAGVSTVHLDPKRLGPL